MFWFCIIVIVATFVHDHRNNMCSICSSSALLSGCVSRLACCLMNVLHAFSHWASCFFLSLLYLIDWPEKSYHTTLDVCVSVYETISNYTLTLSVTNKDLITFAPISLHLLQYHPSSNCLSLGCQRHVLSVGYSTRIGTCLFDNTVYVILFYSLLLLIAITHWLIPVTE